MSKDISIKVALPPDLKEWVEAQAQDIGATAAIWIRMLIVAARKGRAPRVPQMPALGMIPRFDPVAAAPGGDPSVDSDAWRGPVEDELGEHVDESGVDVDAIVANRVAEADVAGLTAPAQPYEAFGPPLGIPANGSGARSLRRPPPAYSPAMQPTHLRGLA